MTHQHELTKGVALVIAGPQGCGKTTLAHAIARRYGRTADSTMPAILSSFALGDLLYPSAPATVVVEGFAQNRVELAWLKELVSSPEIRIDRRLDATRLVKTPNFIFCTGDVDALKLAGDSRRFHVIRLASPSKHGA